MSLTTTEPVRPTTADSDLINDLARVLVELSAYPADHQLIDAAAQLLPAVADNVRAAAGHSSHEADDAAWLEAWRPYGIVRERTR